MSVILILVLGITLKEKYLLLIFSGVTVSARGYFHGLLSGADYFLDTSPTRRDTIMLAHSKPPR